MKVSVLPLAMRKRSPATVRLAPPVRLTPWPVTARALVFSAVIWLSFTAAPLETSTRPRPVVSAACWVRFRSGALARTRSRTAPPLTDRSAPAALALEPTRSTRADAPLPTMPAPPETRITSEPRARPPFWSWNSVPVRLKVAPPLRVRTLAVPSFAGSR